VQRIEEKLGIDPHEEAKAQRIKERNTNWKIVKTNDEGGSFSNVAKAQVKGLIFGAGQSTKPSNDQR
jgi:hypothetical protein